MEFTRNDSQCEQRLLFWPLFLLLAVIGVGGCGKPSAAPEKTVPDSHGEHGHDAHGHGGHPHPTEGPHHGQLIELGNEAYHGEWVRDAATGSITIYILDGQARNEVAIGKDAAVINLFVDGLPQQIRLIPQPSAGNAAGQTSRFKLPDSATATAIDREKGRGELRVMIQGKSYRGPLPKP